MERTSIQKIMGIKSYLKSSMNMDGKTVEEIRQAQKDSLARAIIPPGTVIDKTTIGNMQAEWVRADKVPEDEKKMILYFHGGSFVSGSCETHRELAARISKASGVRVLVIEYRLAPEYKYPAANEDCVAAYRWLIENGISSDDIVIGGESIGGYLVLETLLWLRNVGEPMPKAAFFLSPHTDFLYYDGESYTSRAELDPTGSMKGAKMCADFYFDPSITEEAALSPLNEDLSGLPSLFIQVGDHEVILSDSTRLAEHAEKAGVDATLEVWDNMWHIFRFMASMLPEGQEAIDNVGKFVRMHLQ